MRIALCVVSANEERNIVGCIHSCFKAIDGVFLLVNGATDRTSELAQYYCMKAGIPCGVMSEPVQTGAPDHLYNRVLDEATAQGYDWILLLDADERLSGFARQNLRKWAEEWPGAYALSRRTIITPYCPTAGGEIEPYTDSIEINENHLRFFKADAVRYPGGEGPHLGAKARPGVEVATLPYCSTCITHDRDGREQLRRDKLRGQYPEVPLPTPSKCAGGWYDYQAAYRMFADEVPEDGTIVELGTYLGRSILDLGAMLQERGKNVRLVGVDPFRLKPNSYQHVEVMEDACRWLPRVSDSIIRAGLGDMVSLLQWDSWEAAKLFDDGSVDAVWVDACHEEHAVRKDLAAWWPKVKRGGLFGGHDFSVIFPGVVGPVTEFAEREGVPLHLDVALGSWLVRKP